MRPATAVGESLARPFDELAAGYDDSFTRTPLGRLMREAVWRRLDAHFGPGDRVLELGCGTGEDAVHLARRGVRVHAVDASPAMVAAARRKALEAGVAERVEIYGLAVEELPEAAPGQPLDGALANFGALNCVADLEALSHRLGGWLRPGATALFCVMGPLAPWELLGFLLRGRPRQAFRRWRPGGARWRGIRVLYPSIGRLSRAFAGGFRRRRVSAIGALLPPPWAAGLARRHPRLVERLYRAERRLERLPPLPWLADHYLIELERR